MKPKDQIEQKYYIIKVIIYFNYRLDYGYFNGLKINMKITIFKMNTRNFKNGLINHFQKKGLVISCKIQ